MTPGSHAVGEFLEAVEPAKRRRDADVLIDLMQDVTNEPPWLYRASIVGFGRYEYRYANGKLGEAPAAAFSPRKRATSIYLSEVSAYEAELRLLGPHTSGRWCLYLSDLRLVDLKVLKHIVRDDYFKLMAAS